MRAGTRGRVLFARDAGREDEQPQSAPRSALRPDADWWASGKRREKAPEAHRAAWESGLGSRAAVDSRRVRLSSVGSLTRPKGEEACQRGPMHAGRADKARAREFAALPVLRG